MTTISLDDFKIHLDAFLNKLPDVPPVPGLVPRATNMILSKPSNSVLHQIPRAQKERLTDGWRDQFKIGRTKT